MRMLLTSVGCMGYIGLIETLKRNKVHVVGVDCNPDAVGFHFCDEHFIVPHGDDNGYAYKLLEICNKHKIDAMVISSDNEILKISEEREMFKSSGVELLLPEHSSLSICNDKRLFYRSLLQWGLPHPTVRTPLDANYPAFLKPRVGKGSEGARKVCKVGDLSEPELLGDYILQDYIEGQEYSVDILADRNSKILSLTQRERLEVDSGISVKAKIVEDKEGADLCCLLNERLNMVGMYCAQYIKNDSGIYFLEVNPRFGGSSILSLEASPMIIPNYLNLLNNKPPEAMLNGPKKISMKRYYKEVYE